jgi:hypothetical protein
VATTESTDPRPSLRIAQLAITNFRTFHGRAVIPFRGPEGDADAIAVFHGDNGSGKSNAMAALDLFFQTAVLALHQTNEESEILVPWDQEWSVTGHQGDRLLVLAYQDRPHGIEGPMAIEVSFTDPRLGRLRATCTPSGDQVRVRLARALQAAERSVVEGDAFAPVPKDERDQLVTWLSTPYGPWTRPLTIVDARRRHQGLDRQPQRSLMPTSLAADLFRLRTSRRPEDRGTWRAFVKILHRFDALRGKEISMEHGPAKLVPDLGAPGSFVEEYGEVPDLVIEDRGRAVLALEELSSGEQQVIVLSAASLLSRSAILAVQEPEISLDYKNQRLLHEVLRDISRQGLVDQILLESHIPTFDGPEVIRFARRADGTTEVRRGPAVNKERRAIAQKAEEQGAKQRWVTRDGYTQLPDNMREDLQLKDGGHVWFLKGPRHWETWPEAEVDELFRVGDEDTSDV